MLFLDVRPPWAHVTRFEGLASLELDRRSGAISALDALESECPTEFPQRASLVNIYGVGGAATPAAAIG